MKIIKLICLIISIYSNFIFTQSFKVNNQMLKKFSLNSSIQSINDIFKNKVKNVLKVFTKITSISFAQNIFIDKVNAAVNEEKYINSLGTLIVVKKVLSPVKKYIISIS